MKLRITLNVNQLRLKSKLRIDTFWVILVSTSLLIFLSCNQSRKDYNIKVNYNKVDSIKIFLSPRYQDLVIIQKDTIKLLCEEFINKNERFFVIAPFKYRINIYYPDSIQTFLLYEEYFIFNRLTYKMDRKIDEFLKYYRKYI